MCECSWFSLSVWTSSSASLSGMSHFWEQCRSHFIYKTLQPWSFATRLTSWSTWTPSRWLRRCPSAHLLTSSLNSCRNSMRASTASPLKSPRMTAMTWHTPSSTLTGKAGCWNSVTESASWPDFAVHGWNQTLAWIYSLTNGVFPAHQDHVFTFSSVFQGVGWKHGRDDGSSWLTTACTTLSSPLWDSHLLHFLVALIKCACALSQMFPVNVTFLKWKQYHQTSLYQQTLYKNSPTCSWRMLGSVLTLDATFRSISCLCPSNLCREIG